MRIRTSAHVGRPQRRSFTPEYKAAIVDEYDALERGSPERGALLRREGLYTSHISEWRRQRDAGGLAGLAPPPRRPGKSAEQRELERLRRPNAQLEGELERTKLALDITGKAHALLFRGGLSRRTDLPWTRPVTSTSAKFQGRLRGTTPPNCPSATPCRSFA